MDDLHIREEELKNSLRNFLYESLTKTPGHLGGCSPMAMLKMLDPRATVNPEERPLMRGLESLEGKVIGIIDNGQSNSTAMFQELAKLMREKFHTAEVVFKTKPSHMQGAPKPIIEEFVSRCDAVITGLGA